MAPILTTGAGVFRSGATYTGLGDIRSFAIWGSVARGYSAAVAAAGNKKAFKIVDGSNANAQDILVLTTGLTDVATLTSWIGAHGTAHVTTLYDQVGTNDLTQSTVANMPTVTLNAIGGLPALTFASSNSQYMASVSAFASTSQPYTFEAVANKTANNGDSFICECGGSSFAFVYAGNTVSVYAGGGAALTASETDGLSHVFQAAFNSASSTINVDGAAQASGVDPGSGSINSVVYIGGSASSTYLDGYIAEVGIYAAVYNSSVQSNARTAYGL